MAETSKSNAFDEPVNIGAQSLAAEYAKALFAAADKAGALDTVAAELDALMTQVVAKLPKLVELLVSNLFTAEHKVAMIDRALKGKVHPLLLNLFKVLAVHDRSHVLRSIQEEFKKLYDKARRRVPVKIVTAAPLAPAQQAAVTERMKSVLGGEP